MSIKTARTSSWVSLRNKNLSEINSIPMKIQCPTTITSKMIDFIYLFQTFKIKFLYKIRIRNLWDLFNIKNRMILPNLLSDFKIICHKGQISIVRTISQPGNQDLLTRIDMIDLTIKIKAISQMDYSKWKILYQYKILMNANY